MLGTENTAHESRKTDFENFTWQISDFFNKQLEVKLKS